MVIYRVLTNNAVVIINESGNEQIVCGKGLAFKKRSGDTIDKNLIKQVFILGGNSLTSKYEELLLEIPIEYVEIAHDIIEYAQISLAKPLNDSLILTLSDHLFTAIQRHKEGIIISNSLLWDIQQLYENEFEIGEYTLDPL